MAIVKCPECGNEISTNATKCVHCGSLFTVCPDCNAVLAGSSEICPVCGCLLKKANAAQPQEKEAVSQTAPQAQAPLTEEEKLRHSFDRVVNNGNHIEKLIKIAGRFVWTFGIIFLIIFIIIFSIWQRDINSAELSVLASRMLSFPKDYEMMRAFLSLTCIGCIVSVIYDNISKIAFRGTYAEIMKKIGADKNQLLLWIQKMCHMEDASIEDNGLKFKSYDCHSEINKRNMNTCYEIIFPSERKKAIIYACILSVWAALNGILIGIAVDKLLITDLFQARLLEVPYGLDLGWLIGVGACLILFSIVSVILRRDGKRKEWIDKNLA